MDVLLDMLIGLGILAFLELYIRIGGWGNTEQDPT